MPHLELTDWLKIAVGALVVANVAASVATVKSGSFTRGQIVAQLALIWLLPVAGAALIAVVLFSDRAPRTRATPWVQPGSTPEGTGGDLGGGHHAP